MSTPTNMVECMGLMVSEFSSPTTRLIGSNCMLVGIRNFTESNWSQENPYNNTVASQPINQHIIMNNQFEVQITTSSSPDIFNPLGWTTVYYSDSGCVEDARRQMKYIMSTEQTRAQCLNPTAVRLVVDGRVNAAFVGSI